MLSVQYQIFLLTKPNILLVVKITNLRFLPRNLSQRKNFARGGSLFLSILFSRHKLDPEIRSNHFFVSVNQGYRHFSGTRFLNHTSSVVTMDGMLNYYVN